MRNILLLLTLILSGCIKSKPEQKATKATVPLKNKREQVVRADSTKQNLIKDDPAAPILYGFKNAKAYRLTDTLKADFNGDGIIDRAIFKKDTIASGIIITHGSTNQVFTIGFGKAFFHLTDLNWVDYWGLVKDKETTETTFDETGDVLGSKTVELQHPSIIVEAHELGGGLITFRNGKYEWIHQTC